MKKAILAVMLAAGFTAAHAQDTSSVTVYGKMRIFMESDKVGTAGAVTKQTNDSSRIGFKGEEDLGNGIKANFVLETGVNADDPKSADSQIGDRRSTLGISSKLGKIDLGRDKHYIAKTFDAYDPAENGTYSSINTIHASQGSRLSNSAVVEVTPFKGITVGYHHGYSESASTQDVYSAIVTAKFGGFSASYVRYDNQTTSKTDLIAASYNLSATGTTFYALHSDNTVSGAQHEGDTVGVKQDLSPSTFVLVGYGRKDGMDAYNAGVTYRFSKRTLAHVRYLQNQADNDSNDRRQIAFGLEHNF